MTSESNVLQECRLAASECGSSMFRNNQGAYKDAKGFYIKYGVCNPGGSDLIGYTPVKITESMVGKTVAVFTALEAKTATGKATPAQINFIEQVKKSGGFAAIVRCAQDVLNLLK